MKRSQIIQYKEPLEFFLERLRWVIWGSIGLSILLFATAILLLYNNMLLSSVVVATLAFLTFRVLREYAVIIATKWVRSRGEQEEMLHFLDEEIKGSTPREFFLLLERALKVIDTNNVTTQRNS